VLNSSLNFSSNITFRNNLAEIKGGGIAASNSNLKQFNFPKYFSKKNGGGIWVLYGSLNFYGNTTFRNIIVQQAGRGTVVSYSTLNFTDNTTFRNNSAEQMVVELQQQSMAAL